MENLREERKQTELDQHEIPANSRRRNDPYNESMFNLRDRGSLCERAAEAAPRNLVEGEVDPSESGEETGHGRSEVGLLREIEAEARDARACGADEPPTRLMCIQCRHRLLRLVPSDRDSIAIPFSVAY
ncbi:hypothetical protein BHE74_00032679, partial [Ensete ventricosum]